MWFASRRALGKSSRIFLERAEFSGGWSQDVSMIESVQFKGGGPGSAMACVCVRSTELVEVSPGTGTVSGTERGKPVWCNGSCLQMEPLSLWEQDPQSVSAWFLIPG